MYPRWMDEPRGRAHTRRLLGRARVTSSGDSEGSARPHPAMIANQGCMMFNAMSVKLKQCFNFAEDGYFWGVSLKTLLMFIPSMAENCVWDAFS